MANPLALFWRKGRVLFVVPQIHNALFGANLGVQKKSHVADPLEVAEVLRDAP